MLKLALFAAAALLYDGSLHLSAQASAPPPNIAAAEVSSDRGDDVKQDRTRHGPEILAFAGVRRGAKVIDLIPGNGYWTRLFSKVVGRQGHVYGVWPDAYAAHARSAVLAYQALSGSKAFPNVTSLPEPAVKLTAPEKVDLVFTAQNYHDYPDKFMGSIAPAVFDAQIFNVLKPGGVFLVIDHVAEPGSGMRDTDTLHRIDPAIVKKQVEAAGFQFVAQSKLLTNSDDDHRVAVFDQSIRGHTDQFIFKFRKPF